MAIRVTKISQFILKSFVSKHELKMNSFQEPPKADFHLEHPFENEVTNFEEVQNCKVEKRRGHI